MRKSIIAGAILVASAGAGAVACAPSSSATPASGSTMPASIIDPYLAIQDALADDKTDGIKTNAGNIATAATALGAPAFKIDTAAVQLAGAADAPTPDIDDVRQKFGALSEAIDTYATGSKLKMPEGVRVAFCPMANKPWMQKGDTLSNPYYGKEMPTCGSFR
ncbi:MAG TPA: hypothetical protein VH583_16335 [Vicinamibacterales bacterium]|jgi:hypothetical protein